MDMIASIPTGECGAFGGLIVGFGAAAGKDDLFGLAIEQRSDPAAGLHNCFFRPSAVPMRT